ncbi:hypothetical protein [Paenibacillus sp. XY044]|uniref:hypothetical protein n=1 Tax=Paenibacillus sp. XY044 TaxID=2026089 RepID=UPI000B98F4B8|nr:hypothetical protein [Paenibacillus sp. XY044]OZB90070.1 hypothetical protein CJP46_35415 [Paenibacillus sp. XY044]
MSDEREVVVVFDKDHRINISTDDPEELLDLILSKDTGWVRHNDVVFRREPIKYAGISNKKSNKINQSNHARNIRSSL